MERLEVNRVCHLYVTQHTYYPSFKLLTISVQIDIAGDDNCKIEQGVQSLYSSTYLYPAVYFVTWLMTMKTGKI